jgi:hypothetical protein
MLNVILDFIESVHIAIKFYVQIFTIANKKVYYYYYYYYYYYWSRDSAVGIATCYWLDDRGVGVRVQVGS